MRDGVLVLSPEIATALLAMADSLRHMLESISVTGNEGDDDYCGVAERLKSLLQAASPATPQASAAISPGSPAPKLGEILVSARHCEPEMLRARCSLQERRRSAG